MARRSKWPRVLGLGCLGVLVLGALVCVVYPGSSPSLPEEVHVPPSNVLVIYYSRTGTTATLGRAIAEASGADLVPIEDTVDRRGPFGFLRSIVDAARKSRSPIRPLRVDPSRYELVLIGTPVWGSATAAPVRAFFEDHRAQLPERVGFFLTDGHSSHDAVFRDMAALAGREPVARLGLAHDDVVQGRYADAVAAFVRSLPVTGSPAVAQE